MILLLILRFRYVDSVTQGSQAQGFRTADNYWELDLRLAGQICDGIEIAVVGQNLLDEAHVENIPRTVSNVIAIERGVFGEVIVDF